MADLMPELPEDLKSDRSEPTGVDTQFHPRRLLTAAALFFATYLIWQLSDPDGAAAVNVGNVFLVAADLLALYAAFGAMRRCRDDPRRYRSWAFISIAMVGYLVGNLLQGYHEVVRHAADTPDWGDAVFYLFFFVGLLGFAQRRQSKVRSWQFILETTTIALSGGAVLWYLVAGPLTTTNGHSVHEVVYAIVYPLGDLVLLLAALRVLQRGVHPSSVPAMMALAAGIFAYVIADTSVGYLQVHGSYQGGDLADIMGIAATMLFVVAGALQRTAQLPESDARPGRMSSSWITYLASAVVFVLVFAVQRHDPFFPDLSIVCVAVVITILIATSQLLGQRALLTEQSKNNDLVDELRHQAFHDGLTGLANRALFSERLEHALARRRPLSLSHAVLMIDLDGFKSVNDSQGHQAGDALLRIVADRLQSVVRRGDTVARVGGDEFAVLLEDVSSQKDTVELVVHLLEAVHKPATIGERVLRPEASIGVALTDEEPRTADELMQYADAAMYLAKEEQSNHFRVFETSMQSALAERADIEGDLRGAVQRNEMRVYYQPILNLASQELAGFEALVRWMHPTRGLLLPISFVPLAEQCGLIHEIDTWVLGQSTMEAAGWQAAFSHIGPLCVHVNVSPVELHESDLVETVAGALASSGLAPELLTLELLESSVVADLDLARSRLLELKTLGVRIAVDDFGTGYSSLSHLRTLPIDELKIDRSFIAAMEDSVQARTLVHSLVELGHALGIDTVAEGIEDSEQLLRLREDECLQGQGYLFSKPISVEDVDVLLRSQPHRTVVGPL
jgi:diguanylate cyclase (GGDEF)-like protein